MASNYLAIAADIKTKLTAVSGIGLVHDYERWAAEWSKFIEFFRDPTGKINGSEITRVAVPERFEGVFFRHHHFRVKSYRGVNDAQATGKAFQVMADDVCDAFRVAEPGTAGVTWRYGDGANPDNSPAQIVLIDDRMFGSVLCHCSEIALVVTERIIT